MTLPGLMFWLLFTPALAAASFSEYMKPSLIGPLLLAAGPATVGGAEPAGAGPPIVPVVVPGTAPAGALPLPGREPGGAPADVGATVGAENDEPSGPAVDPTVSRTVVPHPAIATVTESAASRREVARLITAPSY